MAVPEKLRSAKFETSGKRNPDGTKAEKPKKPCKHINWVLVEGTPDFELLDFAAAECSKKISVFIKDAARKAARLVLANKLVSDDATDNAE